MCKDISSIIFDVDKTLCSVNCGDRLIRYMIAREHFSFVRLFAMYSNYFIYRLGLLNRNDGVRLSHQVYRGFNLKELETKCSSVIGIEVNKHATGHARDLGCQVFQEDIQQRTHFEANSFENGDYYCPPTDHGEGL